MKVSVHACGRSVSVDADVPGSQDEVWQAIASGEGITGWFLPTEVQHGFDGDPVRFLVHPDARTLRLEIKEWSPPQRLAAVCDDLQNGAPALTTEWMLEPLALGCRVRVRHTLDTSATAWDELLLGMQRDWQTHLSVLKVYIGNFSGKRCQTCTVNQPTHQEKDKAWETLSDPLGLHLASVGERVRSEADGPELAGVLEAAEESHQALIRLDQPAAGIAHLQILETVVGCVATVRLYFYGDQASAILSREEPRWQAWLSGLYSA
jgi:uncharacterized protein YndB with AHSA1/START domain